VVGLVVLVLVPLVAYRVGRRAATLEESVLNASPPAAGEILAGVEEKVVGSLEVFRGQLVLPDEPLSVSFSDPVVLMSVPVGVGDVLGEGSVLAVVDDRPVFVLGGEFPLIHGLVRGDTGTMVSQLQAALARVGLYGGDVDGRYGYSTKRAVRALFEDAGFDAPDAGVPVGSVVFVDGLPARVASVGPTVGDVLEGEVELMRLSTGDPTVEVSFGADDADIFQAGMSATLTDLATGAEYDVVLDEIVDAVGSDLPDRKTAWFRSAGADISGVDPTDITVTVDLRPSDTPSLVVPATGVYADAGGSTYVLKATGDGDERVMVEVLFSGDGDVAISVPDGSLQPGDKVVVGVADGG